MEKLELFDVALELLNVTAIRFPIQLINFAIKFEK